MAIQVGIAPDSWGVWFPNHEKQTPWSRCMDEMRQAGYDGVELGPWGYFPNTYPELKQALDARSLELVAGTVGGDFLNDASIDDMCQTIDEIAAVIMRFPQAKYIVLLPAMYTDLETGEFVMDPNLTDAQWATYCKNVQRAADRVASHGLIGAFHPHVDCHVQTEEQIERLLTDTDVQLCFDTGHHVYGGGEPIAFYKKHADRIPYIHIKDCDLAVKAKMDENKWSFAKAVTEDIMVEPGKGSIDFAKLHDALVEKGYDGWVVVEQDLFPVKSFDIPLPIAKRGRENLAKAGF
ncbi:sugar phosphate isomerase/epimerase family protein [Butyricicoccus sp. Marseille-Q5471]|uniref:sugar phosphate isomerase/epimerase family protein n=1 Tax=Butyricicoccus sp. Marseille-Q5471 TaxID=3039493 RepID=UPI0024BC0638|nr:sugar phosphate isomerase/epimerase [Butyricicoccus sp. Marseille-Q5471]